MFPFNPPFFVEISDQKNGFSNETPAFSILFVEISPHGFQAPRHGHPAITDTQGSLCGFTWPLKIKPSWKKRSAKSWARFMVPSSA